MILVNSLRTFPSVNHGWLDMVRAVDAVCRRRRADLAMHSCRLSAGHRKVTMRVWSAWNAIAIMFDIILKCSAKSAGTP